MFITIINALRKPGFKHIKPFRILYLGPCFMKTNAKKIRNTCCSLLSCFLIISCGKEQENGQQQEENQAIQVRAALVEADSFARTVSTTANLLPFEQVDIKAPVAGNVLAIYFKEGERVGKGEQLIRIDDRSWRAQLQGLQAQLERARSELERNQELIEREGISREELEQAEAQVRNLEAQAKELRVNIQLANVKAPLSGQLGMRDFSLGDYLQQGQTITQLVQKDRLRVDFTIPAEYAPHVRQDQEMTVIASATGDTLQALVYAISPAISLNSREIRIRGLLDNREGQFIPGDFAQVQLNITQKEEALLIPAEAVLPEAETHVVFKAQNGRAMRQEVSLGLRTPSRIQILEGLSQGDTVLITGLMQVEDSSRIEVEALKERAL